MKRDIHSRVLRLEDKLLKGKKGITPEVEAIRKEFDDCVRQLAQIPDDELDEIINTGETDNPILLRLGEVVQRRLAIDPEYRLPNSNKKPSPYRSAK
jgi:hypothetical protein